jgi:hypothetical protein
MEKCLGLLMVVLVPLMMLLRPGVGEVPPPKPTPIVSFTASGEVEHHLPEETRFGKCE